MSISSFPFSMSKILITAFWNATATFLRSVLIASTAHAPGASPSLWFSLADPRPSYDHDSLSEPPPDGPLTSQTFTVPSAPQLMSVLSSRTSARSHTASVCPISSPRARVASYDAYVVCDEGGSAHIRMDESSDAEYSSCFEGACTSLVIAAECPRNVSCGSTSVVGLDLSAVRRWDQWKCPCLRPNLRRYARSRGETSDVNAPDLDCHVVTAGRKT